MLTIVIQAGGESRRMGQDKALVSFLDKPLISRVIERVRPVADELLITTNRPESYRFLGIPLISDLIPGRGALGGLYTALSAAGTPLVAIVACDMPFVNPTLITAERDLLENLEWDAAIPRLDTGTEPFHAVYRRHTCLPYVQTALDSGRWRVDAWFSEARIRFISQQEVQRYDPQLLAFSNVNNPDELHQAEDLARSSSIH